MPVISKQLKPIDTVNGFQIRPGFFREFGAVAIPGGVNFRKVTGLDSAIL